MLIQNSIQIKAENYRAYTETEVVVETRNPKHRQ